MTAEQFQWTPFVSEEERLNYLKEHKLTPKTFKEPKPLFYSGMEAEGSELCTAEGTAGPHTLVIAVGEKYLRIHPDYLLEMQGRKSSTTAKKTVSTPKRAPAPKKGVDFIAIDFETATGSYASACALGIAVVENMEVTKTWYHLIRPPMNRYEEDTVRIHGITPAQTENEPTLDQLWQEIRPFFEGNLAVAHNARFDFAVLRSSLSRPGEVPNFKYADTISMAKRVVSGRVGLDACCAFFGIPLEHHHNALDDAVACANVAICCARAAGCGSVSEYVKREKVSTADFHKKTNPYNQYANKAVKISEISATVDQFDLTHPLYLKNIVFTGDLSIDRAEAMQLAVNKGAVVKSGVSKKTDILVIGRQGEAPGAPMNSKERKARELMENGSGMRIMEEGEFLGLVR